MELPPRSAEPAGEQARCFLHPERPAQGACRRCGAFFCLEERCTFWGEDYCAACAKRPEVDYLEDFRRRCWGKRDAWAWLIGLGAVSNLVMGLVVLSSRDGTMLSGLGLLALAVLGACFWLGLPFARPGLFLLPVFSAGIGWVTRDAEGLPGALWSLFFVTLIYHDTRNQLFFRVDVPREKLGRAWELYVNNPLARIGFLLGLLGLLLPVLAPVALSCSLLGLRRVNPAAHPPIGRKGQAVAGIVFGVLGSLWGVVLVLWLYG